MLSTWGPSQRQREILSAIPTQSWQLKKKGFFFFFFNLKLNSPFWIELLMEPLQKHPREARSLRVIISEDNSGQPSSDSCGANLLEVQFLRGHSFACFQELCTAPVDALTCQSLPQHC